MNVYRARLFTPLSDPFVESADDTCRFFEDAHLAVDDAGRIASVGDWKDLPETFRDVPVTNLGRTRLISPGFFDTHLHAPQLEMIGSYGGHLLEWLNRYTFPTERKFEDSGHATKIARAFFDELLRNGTFSALVFSTIHREATDIFFTEAERRGFRAIIGKTMMDRNAPDFLLDTPQNAYDDCRMLIEKWHNRGLLRYAVTPRFAPTSTPELLEVAGTLKREFADTYMHSHISENQNEIAWVQELFPDAEYADVYDRYGLLDSRSVLAHGVWLTAEELDLLARRGTRIAHCPNSNLFLGSGLFKLHRALNAGVIVGLGSDIGAGTTPSMFTAMSDAYKVQQVQGVSLSPIHLWYLATLGGARALSLDAECGSLEVGKSADFLVLDLEATPLLTLRNERAESVGEILSALIFMGDERAVARGYVAGQLVTSRQSQS